MKKIISLLCVFALCITLIPTRVSAAEITFSDVDASTAQGAAIYKMAKAGILDGVGGGRFEPDGYLTRAQFAKVANLVFGISNEPTDGFSDVPTTHWAYSYIMTARAYGYINGVGNGKFAPDSKLTREQFCAMVGRINHFENTLNLQIAINDTFSSWAKNDIINALVCGLFEIPADGMFRATEHITRGEMAIALAQYVSENTGGGTTDGTTGGSTGGTTGGGSTDGGTTNPGGNGGTTNPGTDEKTPDDVVAALEDAVAGLASINTTYYTSDMKKIVNTMKSTMTSALADNSGGAVITREYITGTYAEQVDTVKSCYSNLTEARQKRVRADIANSVSVSTLDLLQDYFLS